MNNMGHCNFELVPKRLFQIFPFFKYLMYTPSYHSLHHTQFRTNYSLFMPLYDYIYGTMDSSTDKVYETSLERKEEMPNIVHLTHPTTLESIYHLRLGFAWLAAGPYTSKWYLWVLLPVTWWSMLVAWIYGQTFVVERNMFNHLKLQTWVVPRYSFQYLLSWQREAINNLIEEAIVEADKSDVKVLSLGLLNQASCSAILYTLESSCICWIMELQGEELNRSGELYIQKHPKLKVRVVDGSSLAVAVVLNSIPKGTKQILLRGNLSKVAFAIVQALCEKGVEVVTVYKDEYEKLKLRFSSRFSNTLIFSKSFSSQVWLVGDGLRKDEQWKAAKGTIFIPFSQFPPTKMRKDCIYHTTPAMMTPKAFQNMHSCENWLPRKVMSAWRAAGIVHALEEWNSHECGEIMLDTENIWIASLRHGFQPVIAPAHN
ncbi:hypothetical protein GIB67_026480 [Kingdonia uniflora]|uniref:Very-long-chain aldehyde decarbonylase CER1-like C-terminal domain-containing protein n=1 Tax=Kingdonia uniflora TaxID=39325 RepID=A0A7J7P6T5_9MAGN|nr:hypothetical protein GIB67_026480 [Kingdonia uniflora]